MRTRNFILILLAAEVGVLAFAYLRMSHAAGGYGFPLDDSWIHAHFARNIAEGRGIVYNPGQHVTSTAVLYSVLLAGLYFITHSPVANAVVLGLALHFTGAVLVYLTARRLEVGVALSVAAAMFFAAIPRLMWGALSGMEVPLYVVLACLGVYWHIRYGRNDGAKAWLPGVAFGLATLARPECAALLVCSVADRVVNYIRFDRSKIAPSRLAKTIVAQGMLFALVVAPAAIYNEVSFGRPLPPAFYAKTRPLTAPTEHSTLRDGVEKTRLYLHETATVVRRDNAVLYVLLIPGLIACAMGTGRSERRGIMILPLALLFIPVATAFAAPLGPHRSLAQLMSQHGRYSAYLCPLVVLIGVLGLGWIASLLDMIPRGRPWIARVAVGAAAVAVAITLWTSDLTTAHRYGLEVRNINDMQVALGKWAAGLPRGTTIAVNDAGAIPYFSRLSIMDTVGVVNPEVVPYLNRYDDRQPGLLEYLQEHRPDYVIIFPTWYPRIAERRDLLCPIKSIRLKHNVVCGGPEMVVYRTKWQ